MSVKFRRQKTRLTRAVRRFRPIGRKNYLFAGSHESVRRAAMICTFFAACKHHGIDPEVWLADVLNRIHDHKVSRLHELMPQNWKPAPKKTPAKAEVAK